jgi:hypothetical protein
MNEIEKAILEVMLFGTYNYSGVIKQNRMMTLKSSTVPFILVNMVVIIVFRSLGGKDSEWLDMKIG